MASATLEEQKREHPQRSGFAVLKNLSAAVGVAGFLAAVGYIAAFARQEFLGFRVGSETTGDLPFASGRFGLGTVLVIAEQLAQNPWKASLIIFLVFAVGYIGRQVRRRVSIYRYFELVIVIVAALIAALPLLWIAIPTIGLRDALTVSVTAQPKDASPNSFFGCRTIKLWTSIVDSHLTSAEGASVGETDPCRKHSDPQIAKSSLEIAYASGVVSCLAGWTLLLFHRQAGMLGSISVLARTAATFCLLLLTLFLPYIFGKVIESTAMQEVSVRYVTPEHSGGQWMWAYLLAESDRSITLLTYDETLSIMKMVEIPRERVAEIDAYDMSDVLEREIRPTPSIWKQKTSQDLKGGHK